jgi:hypothetical protein
VEQLKIELQQFIYKKFISFDGDELKVDTEFVTAMQRFVSDPKSRHIITKLWIYVLASTNRLLSVSDFRWGCIPPLISWWNDTTMV